MAIITRWRWPPESSCGKARAERSGSGRPTSARSSIAAPAPAGPVEGAVGLEGFGDLVGDPHHRVERGHRLLEDHADARARARSRMARSSRPRRSCGPEADAAGDRAHSARQQAHDGVGGERLARPRFADDAERLARADRERQVLDRMRPVRPRRQGEGEALDGEDGLGHPRPAPGRAAG